jgi:peroxiredoxin
MIKGFKIPKVIFRVREGDTSNNEAICAIGGKWIDKSTDDYFKGKRVILFSLTWCIHTNMFITTTSWV